MPSVRRRFLVMLWLSLALHALVIGLARLPSPVRVPLPADMRVEILQPAAAIPSAEAAARQNEPRPRTPERREPVRMPAPTKPVQPPAAALSAPEAVAATSPSVAMPTPRQPSAAAAINIPLLADMRYYTARELDVQPSALRNPQPLYPARAEEQSVAGRVLVRLHLEADGSVSRIEIVSVAPGGAFGDMFRKSTLDSLGGVRFRPAQRNGQPVRAVVEIPVVFEPDG